MDTHTHTTHTQTHKHTHFHCNGMYTKNDNIRPRTNKRHETPRNESRVTTSENENEKQLTTNERGKRIIHERISVYKKHRAQTMRLSTKRVP